MSHSRKLTLFGWMALSLVLAACGKRAPVKKPPAPVNLLGQFQGGWEGCQKLSESSSVLFRLKIEGNKVAVQSFSDPDSDGCEDIDQVPTGTYDLVVTSENNKDFYFQSEDGIRESAVSLVNNKLIEKAETYTLEYNRK